MLSNRDLRMHLKRDVNNLENTKGYQIVCLKVSKIGSLEALN